jgi:hypothetical protein
MVESVLTEESLTVRLNAREARVTASELTLESEEVRERVNNLTALSVFMDTSDTLRMSDCATRVTVSVFRLASIAVLIRDSTERTAESVLTEESVVLRATVNVLAAASVLTLESLVVRANT